jgi:hypothetical protein
MKIQLTRKLAERLDGIDVSAHRVGDVLDLTDQAARLLIAERWALPVSSSHQPGALSPDQRRQTTSRQSAVRNRECSSTRVRATAADLSVRWSRSFEQLDHVREQLAQGRFEPQEHRRAEDRIRDELHDARARTLRLRRRSSDAG